MVIQWTDSTSRLTWVEHTNNTFILQCFILCPICILDIRKKISDALNIGEYLAQTYMGT